MTLNLIFTGLAGGIQSLSALLTIITSDGIEQQILDHSSGPLVMGSSMLGSSGQLGLVRAALKISFGLSRVSKAKIEVKDLKHISTAAVESTGYGVSAEYGLNPRNEQPLLTDFLKNRDWPVWIYFGMRPSREQSIKNRRINILTFLCFIIAALMTGATAIPICIQDGRPVHWILTMLNPFGLCILAIAFVRIRGGIRRYEQDLEIDYQKMKPKLACIGSSIGFIDSRALERYPGEEQFDRILLFFGSICVLVGFVASYAFFQRVETRYAYIWVGIQVFLLLLRYLIWFIRPWKTMRYMCTEMGCRAKQVLSSLEDLKADEGQDFVLCIAAARLKEVGHELKEASAMAARKILPKLMIDKMMFKHQDLHGNTLETGDENGFNTSGDDTLNTAGDDTLNTGEFSTCIKLEMEQFNPVQTNIELIFLPWSICYAISRAMAIIPASEPWTGRHHRLCAIMREGKSDIVISISIQTMAQEPNQKLRDYILIGEKPDGELDLCSQFLYRVYEGESLKNVGNVELLNEESNLELKEEIFNDAKKYLASIKVWRDNLISADNKFHFDRDEHLSSNTLRRLIVRDTIPLDITIGLEDRQVEQYWKCVELD